MVSFEGVKSKLKEIERKNPVGKKPKAFSKDYVKYMTQKIILQNAKYVYLLDIYPEIDKFTLRHEN